MIPRIEHGPSVCSAPRTGDLWTSSAMPGAKWARGLSPGLRVRKVKR